MRVAVRHLAALAVLFGAISASPAMADVWPMKTPSGNIECYVGMGEGPSDIQCTIYEKGGTPPQPKPAACGDAWGHHYDLMAYGTVRIKCGSPGRRSTASGVDVFPYGAREDFGGIVCSSSQKGLECRNSEGHGFFLSRSSQRVF